MWCFSALQRAENSSIFTKLLDNPLDSGFSALQRAENSSMKYATIVLDDIINSFSALQRAENSSIPFVRRLMMKILCFSALQRAENSSIDWTPLPARRAHEVSVLFSEPKIPQ